MRVLIVEDDAALGTYLQRGLKFEGHDVTLVADGQSGLSHALEHEPDLMVLGPRAATDGRDAGA